MSELDDDLRAHETDLTGTWIIEDGRMTADVTCQRIEWITTHSLTKVAENHENGAWETVYQDPKDGRYWERTYPQSEMHGGGPPRLRVLTIDEYRRRYAGG
jgi:hypothetical protein